MRLIGGAQAALVALTAAGLAQAQYLINDLSFGMNGK